MMRGFQIWSQNLNRITSNPFFENVKPLSQKMSKTCKVPFLTVISPKSVKCYPIEILRPDLESSHPGLRSWSRDRICSRSDRQLWPESKSELESVKSGRLLLRLGVAGYHPSTDVLLAKRLSNVHPSENIEKQAERESGSGQMKPKRRLVVEFRLIKVSEIIYDHLGRL